MQRDSKDADAGKALLAEQVQLLVAELLATNAVVASGSRGNGVQQGKSGAHSAEVKTFHTLFELGRLMEGLTEKPSEDAPAELQQRHRDRLRLVQPSVEKCLMELIVGQLASLSLAPTMYRLVGRLLRMLMERGDARNIMAVTNDLQDHLGPKSALSAHSKTAAFYCLGEISSCKQGRMLAGHLKETTQHVARIFRTAANASTKAADNALRCAAVRALASGLQGSETAGRSNHAEALKILIRAASDKSPPVRAAVAEAVLTLALASDRFSSVPLDQVVTLSKRGLEDRVAHVRSSYAKTLGAVLCIAVEISGPIKPREPDAEISTTLSSTSSSSSSSSSSISTTASGMSGGSESSGGTSNGGASGGSGIMAPKSAAASAASRLSAGLNLGSASPRGGPKIRGFTFPTNFGSLGVRAKPDAPTSYTLHTALDALSVGFDSWTPDLLEKRADLPSNQTDNETTQRSVEVRMAFAEAAVELLRYLQRAGDMEQQHLVITATLAFVRNICNDIHKHALKHSARERDDTFRRAVAIFVLGRALSAKMSESGKIEVVRQLLSYSTKQLASSKSARGERSSLKRRGSRTMASISLAAQAEFENGPLFISACLSEAAFLLSSLGDASRALFQELDFQVLLPLLEHRDPAVRLECCNVLYVCAITQPGYAARGILPLLQLVGLYQPELAMTLASGPPSNSSPLDMDLFNMEADRTLQAIEGLVHALCVFVYSSSANGRPRSTSAEAFLEKENLLLPAAAHFVRHEVPNSSTALLSGDLKGIPENTSMALLGHAKSMIARQHDGTTRPEATARIASCGWALVGALVTLGAKWCADNLGQLFQAWQSSVEACLPALERVAHAKNPSELFRDGHLEASFICLQASLHAMLGFVRCNQSILRDMPAVSRAVVILVEQVVQAQRKGVRELPFANIFMGIHAALFDICAWLPRAELRTFKQTIVIPLQSLAMAYFLGPAGSHQEGKGMPSTALSSLLSFRSGVLKISDEVLETASLETGSPTRGDGDEGEPLGRKQWRFEEVIPASPSRELFMSARLLSAQEAYLSAASCMTSLSCNASHSAVAMGPPCSFGSGNPTPPSGAIRLSLESSELIDSAPACGMVRVNSPKTAQNCVDAAVAFSSVVLTSLFDDKDRANFVHYLFTLLKRRAGEAQHVALHNGVTALLAFLNTLANMHAEVDHKKAPWVGRVRSIFCVAIASNHSLVRQACASGLAILTRLAGPSVGFATFQTLRRKLDGEEDTTKGKGAASTATKTPAQRSAVSVSPSTKAGIVLAFALIRREASMHDTRYIKNTLVYDMCKLTIQPIRTTALHAWQVVVESAGIDVYKFVGPSFALINAHLLALDGHYECGNFGAARVSMGTLTCLARLANSLIEGLGPELARPDLDSVRFLNVWEALRNADSNDPMLQLELTRLVQQILLFHPSLIMQHSCDRERVKLFLLDLIMDVQEQSRPAVRMAALQALSLLTERMTDEESSGMDLLRGALSLLSFELVFRGSLCQDWIIPPASSLGHGAVLLSRSRRPNSSTEPLLIHAANVAFRDTGSKSQLPTFNTSSGSDPYDTASVRGKLGFDSSTSGVGLSTRSVDPYALCEVSESRVVALRNLLKFVGLSHMKMRSSERKDHAWNASELVGVSALTDWMKFFRGVMTGMTDALGQSISTHDAENGKSATGGNSHGMSYGNDDDDDDDDDDEGDVTGSTASGMGMSVSVSTDRSANVYSAVEATLFEVCDRVLSKCSWETKVLAVEGLLEVLGIAKTYPFHCDLEEAENVLRKVDLPVRGQFICMHLRELLAGASQAANGTIQSAEVPQLSIQGYCALVEIVRMFASSRDKFQPEDSVLKQFEMQLTATLGPGLGKNASPLVLPFVGILAVQLLVTGVSTSARRIVGLLLPSQISSPDEDDDEEDLSATVENTDDRVDMDQMPSFVQAELLILRLIPLARLWLFAHGCDTISPTKTLRSLHVPKALRNKPSKKKGIKAIIEKALLDFMSKEVSDGTVKRQEDLVDAWAGVVHDVAKLAVPLATEKQHGVDAFSLVDASDAVAVFPAYLNAAWVVNRALCTLAEVLPKRTIDQELVLRTALILAARAQPMDWPPLALGTIFQTIALALPVIKADTRECEDIAILTSLRVLRDEATYKITHGEFVAIQAYHVISEVIRMRCISQDSNSHGDDVEEKCTEPENASESWHHLVEAVLLPVQALVGGDLKAQVKSYKDLSGAVVHTVSKEAVARSMIGAKSTVLSHVAARALADFGALAKAFPASCAKQYTQILAWNAFVVIQRPPKPELLEAAQTACRELLTYVPELGASLFGWALGLLEDFQRDGIDNKNVSTLDMICRMVCSVQFYQILNDAEFNAFAFKLSCLVDTAKFSATTVVLTLAAVRCLIGDDNVNAAAVQRVVSLIGPGLSQIVRGVDLDEENATACFSLEARFCPESVVDERLAENTLQGSAILTLAHCCKPVGELTQLVVIMALSLAEGHGSKVLKEESLLAAQAALVFIATNRAEQFRNVVQTLSPPAMTSLQTSMKTYLQGVKQ